MKISLVITTLLTTRATALAAHDVDLDGHSTHSLMARMDALEAKNAARMDALEAKNAAFFSEITFLKSQLMKESRRNLRGRTLEENEIPQDNLEMMFGSYHGHALLEQLKDITTNCVSFSSGSDTCYFGSGDQGDSWQTHAIMSATVDVQIDADEDGDGSGVADIGGAGVIIDTDGDIDLTASEDINLKADSDIDMISNFARPPFGGNINMKAFGNGKVDIDGGTVRIDANRGDIILSASTDVGISAIENLNIVADEDVRIQGDNDATGGGSVSITSQGDGTGDGVFIAAKNDIHIKAQEDTKSESGVAFTGGDIDFLLSMPSDEEKEEEEVGGE